MPLRRPIRLHRQPLVDALLLVVAVVLAVVLLRSAVARPEHLVVVSDSTRFDAAAAQYNTQLLSGTFRFRVTGTPRARAAAAWLASRFEQLGLDTQQQTFTLHLRGQRLTGTNVVARSGGRLPGAIVLMAHYDGPTTAGQSVAASASGVGTMLELARLLELRAHAHPFVYVALDAGTWGREGAEDLARRIADPDSVVAAISIDHVANGPAAGVEVEGIGQGPGYAPLWLRVAAEDAFAFGATTVHDVGPFREWFLRSIRLSQEDQGPLVARGVPAINLGTVPTRPTYARFLFHTPGDRVETLDSGAFRMLGAGVERLVLTLDRNDRPDGSFSYLRVGDDRMVRGVAILVAAILLFLPLGFATWEAVTVARVDPAARVALTSEVVRAVGWWLIGGAGYLALQALVVTNVLPRFSHYPATERDPFLYDVRWLSMIVALASAVVVALVLARARRRAGLGITHPYAGRAVALSTLALLAAIALAINPFAAVWLLALPAWLWPWIGPTRRPLTGAAGIVLVFLSALPALAIAFLVGQHYDLGVRTGWYVFLQSAYGAWSPFTTIAGVVLALAGWRLVGTTTSRLLPDTGD